MRLMDKLVAPIAHRGLHDRANGIVENTLSAACAAIDSGYGIELDVQRAACGTPVVFHDKRLHRLTESRGRVVDCSAVELGNFGLRGTDDRIATLNEFLGVIDGRVPVFLEIKSDWCGNGGRKGLFLDQIARALRTYRGPVAVMSFDPFCLLQFRQSNPRISRGLVVGGTPTRYAMPIRRAWVRRLMKFGLAQLIARPDFIAKDIRMLSSRSGTRQFPLTRLPVVAWTIRSAEALRFARRHADGLIFEKPVQP